MNFSRISLACIFIDVLKFEKFLLALLQFCIILRLIDTFLVRFNLYMMNFLLLLSMILPNYK